jgi:membrane protein
VVRLRRGGGGPTAAALTVWSLLALLPAAYLAGMIQGVLAPDAPALLPWLPWSDEPARPLLAAAAGLVLAFSALRWMATLERGFDSICKAPQRRSVVQRIPLYWTMLTLGPLLTAAGAWLPVALGRSLLVRGVPPFLVVALGLACGALLLWSLLLVLYRFVPNLKISFSSLASSAAVSAVLLALVAAVMVAVLLFWPTGRPVLHLVLGIPVAVLGVHLAWSAVLLGLQVGAALEYLEAGVPEGDDPRRAGVAGLVDPSSVLALMQRVSSHFADGRATPVKDLVDHLGLPESTVCGLLEPLIQERLLHRIHGTNGSFHGVCLARPADQVSAEEVMRIGYDLADAGRNRRPSPLMEQMREVQIRAARGMTLDLLEPDRSPARGSRAAVRGGEGVRQVPAPAPDPGGSLPGEQLPATRESPREGPEG